MAERIRFLVLGSWIAGPSYALKVAPMGKVLIVTNANDIATWYAQGGIAAVMYNPIPTKNTFRTP